VQQEVTQTLDLEGLRRKIWRRSHSLNSLKVFEHAVKAFESFLEPKTLRESLTLDPSKTLERFVEWMDERGFRSQTQKSYLTYVKRFYAHHGIYVNPQQLKEKITLPKPQVFEDAALTKEEAKRIILECHNPELRALITLVKDTLARPSELISLRLEHVNLAHDPPYLTIPAYAAKNNLPREAFFTNETKQFLVTHLQRKNIAEPHRYIFLSDKEPLDPIGDEVGFQKAVMRRVSEFGKIWLLFLRRRLKDLAAEVEQRGATKRYRLHIYSWKKYGFTKIADTLGELAAHAIAGHKAYLITYYKKTREERAEDFKKVAPKLQLFAEEDQREKMKRELAAALDGLPSEGLAQILRVAKSLLKG
jgi:integrase